MKQVFLIVDGANGSAALTDAQYKRLRNQLNRQWKKNHPNVPRPILLEGGIRVQVEDIE